MGAEKDCEPDDALEWGELVRLFGGRKDSAKDPAYNGEAEKAAVKGNIEKVRIRLFDSYGNVERVNVHVKSEEKFLEKAKEKIAKAFGGG